MRADPGSGGAPPPVKVTCPDCGHIRIPAAELRLVVTASRGASFYQFSCPDCDRRVRRPVTKSVAGALLARRVPAVHEVDHG